MIKNKSTVSPGGYRGKALTAGVWYTAGNIMLKGCMFFTLPVFTRLMSTADFGEYNSYVAYEQILSAIFGLGMYSTVKIAKIEFEKLFDDYMKVVALICLLIFTCFGIIANFVDALNVKVFGFSSFVMNCLFAHSLGDALLAIYGAKLNIEFKYRSYIVMSALNILGSIVISIVLIVYVFPNERYIGRIIGSAVPLILIGIFVVVVLLHNGKLSDELSPKFARYALTIGIPLVPHALSNAILGQFDRIMINEIVGSSAAGIYSYMYTLCTILYVILNSIDAAWTPWTFITRSKGRVSEIRKISNTYIGIAAVMTVGFIAIMPEIATLVASSEYWSGFGMIVPLTLGNYFIFLYSLAVNVEYYFKKTVIISIGTVAASLINIVLNYYLIPVCGYEIAAYNTFFAYLALFVFHLAFARKMGFYELYNIKFIIKTTVGLSLFGLCINLIDPFSLLSVLIRYGAVVFFLIFIYIYRDKYMRFLRRAVCGEKR